MRNTTESSRSDARAAAELWRLRVGPPNGPAGSRDRRREACPRRDEECEPLGNGNTRAKVLPCC